MFSFRVPKLAFVRRHLRRPGRRGSAAIAIAIAAFVEIAVPAHAGLEYDYVLPKAPCQPYLPQYSHLCEAQTLVHVLLPTDYAPCVALVTANAYGWCGFPAFQDITVDANLDWTPGSCATSVDKSGYSNAFAPTWSKQGERDTSGPSSCSTIDEAYTLDVSMPDCSETTVEVTAEIKGNADGTFTAGHTVTTAGPCAAAFGVIVIEGSDW